MTNIIIITQQQKTFQFFKQINQAHWEAFQKNKLTKDEVLSHRFIEYFNHYGIEWMVNKQMLLLGMN